MGITKRFKVLKHLLHVIEFVIALPIICMVCVLPTRWANHILSRLAFFIGKQTNAHKTAIDNLQNAKIATTTKQANRIARNAWYNLGYILSELFYWHNLDDTKFKSSVTVKSEVDDLSGAVLLSMHYGNWEMLLRYLSTLPCGVTCIYRHMNNPYVDWLLKHLRSKHGLKLVRKNNANIKNIINSLKKGSSFGMLIDHHTNNGVLVNFFGRKVMCSSLPAKLAIKHNAPLVVSHVRRTAHLKYTLEIKKLDCSNKTEQQIMQEIYYYFQSNIQLDPAQWFWQHNRWRYNEFKEL